MQKALPSEEFIRQTNEFVSVKPSDNMLGNPRSYANKKRKKPVLKQKKATESNEVVKSNPSKRHRDRLNGELDRLTELLPFSGDIRSRLDKLSVLRLSVGYLRVKSYFKATMTKSGKSSLLLPGVNGQNGSSSLDTTGFSEGDLLLQALNGFVVVVTSDGLVFYVSPTVKDYLGFHQSDVVHQSVFELIHTDDRALFQQQLHFALNPPNAGASGDALQSCGSTTYNPETLPPENSSFLERTFVCRFRCLLDNSSGFLTLKFQGRLKYLHGQKVVNGSCNQPQLALFAIAIPVQPPTIVEIRSKMLLFQTKHKLDFTPMGVDSRGKIVLGYSETELCMKGSGYQFIHAADMMYCADSHVRMIKTGETGMVVFRLLSKSSGWVWVKSNAKLIYKGGRPEFIIAFQRALVNAEGEEYLRQRRLQIPFNFTTGEGVLYNTSPSVDVKQFQFNKMFSNMEEIKKDVTPGSLLDCFLSQDPSAYTQTVDMPLPVDQVFMDSQALVGVAGDAWQESGTISSTGSPVVVKQEAKQSVMAVIDNLEKMAQDGDFCAALQNLDVSDVELMEWENTINRLSQDENQQNNVKSELDSILTNDIFDYIDTMLFKEKGDDGGSPSCLSAAKNTQQDLFTPNPPQLSAHRDPGMFQTPSPDRTFSPISSLYTQQQLSINGVTVREQDSAQIFSSSQKLSHLGPLIPDPSLIPDATLDPLQQLQLPDIFSPAIELPELTVPEASAPFPSCGQASVSHVGCTRGIPAQTQSSQLLQYPPNDFLGGGPLLQSSAQQRNNVAPGVMDILPPLIPCNAFNTANTPNIPIPFATTCLQGSPAFETHNHQVQPWQNQQQNLTHGGIMQNGHKSMPACHSQTPESQTHPRSGLWPNGGTGLTHPQQGGLTCGQVANHSSCMFDQHFSSAPAGGDILSVSGSAGLRANVSLDQSPPQGSCYFQWNHGESVVGTSAINQENINVSPPNMASEHALNIQHNLKCGRQIQDERAAAEGIKMFATPAGDVAMYRVTE